MRRCASVRRLGRSIVPVPGVSATWTVKGDEGFGLVRDQRDRLTAGPTDDRAVGEACSFGQCGRAVLFNGRFIATSHRLLRGGPVAYAETAAGEWRVRLPSSCLRKLRRDGATVPSTDAGLRG